MARYVIHPGPVISRTDGQIHHVGFRQLLHLYRVPVNAEVICYPDVSSAAGEIKRRLWKDRPDDIHLYPRASGDYTLPKESN